jgi:predicted MPP superfamily phosphohydrolase
MRIEILLGLTAVVAARSDAMLKFNSEGKFKMVQFTDMHYGEGDDKDQKNNDLIKAILGFEQPDFVINTGDVVSGYMWDGETTPWTSIYWNKFATTIQDAGYHWASTAGNHDTQGDLTRQQVSDLDVSYDMAMTKPNAEPTLTHAFNYMLPVYD